MVIHFAGASNLGQNSCSILTPPPPHFPPEFERGDTVQYEENSLTSRKSLSRCLQLVEL